MDKMQSKLTTKDIWSTQCMIVNMHANRPLFSLICFVSMIPAFSPGGNAVKNNSQNKRFDNSIKLIKYVFIDWYST